MGVDYECVAGFGIELTSDILKKFIESGEFTEEEWNDYKDECFYDLGLKCVRSGNHYSGDRTYYLFVEGNNLSSVISNSKIFISTLDRFGVSLTESDLRFVSELNVW